MGVRVIASRTAPSARSTAARRQRFSRSWMAGAMSSSVSKVKRPIPDPGPPHVRKERIADIGPSIVNRCIFSRRPTAPFSPVIKSAFAAFLQL